MARLRAARGQAVVRPAMRIRRVDEVSLLRAGLAATRLREAEARFVVAEARRDNTST